MNSNVNLTTTASPADVLREARQKALRISLLALTVLLAFTAIPSIVKALNDDKGLLASVYVLLYLVLATSNLIARRSHLLGSFAVLGIFGALAVSEFYYYGLASLGYFFLWLLVFFAQLFLGLRAAILSLISSLGIVALFATVYTLNLIPMDEPEQVTSLEWLNWFTITITSLSFMASALFANHYIFGRIHELALKDHRLIGVLQENVERRKLAEDELRENQAQLLQSQKMQALGQFAAGVAHDFNNLLQGAQGFTELALGSNDLSAENRENLSEAQLASGRAATLVRQLLIFSRQDPIESEDIDVGKTLESLRPLIRSAMGEQISFTLECADGLPAVFINRARFEQVIINVCMNARDAMKEGGDLRVSAACEDSSAEATQVVIEITDNGCGIPAESVERVFEPFFTSKPIGEGTGLGLATSYSVVDGAGGSIRCKSEEGVGTTFTINLPASDGSADILTSSPLVKSSAKACEEMTVLVAEDEDAVRSFVCRILESEGFRVIAVADGKEAEKVIRDGASAIDLAILDIVMPERLGTEVAEVLRETRGTVPVVFMTGYDAGISIPASSGGVLHKPFKKREFLSRVTETLSGASGS